MTKLKLTDREWKSFEIGDLFLVKIGKSIDGNKVERQKGKTAYITRKEQLNGLDGFIDYDENFLNQDFPVITVGNETAEPFVQTYPFFTGTKVNILKPKKKLNKEVLSFIATSLKQHKSKYSYSFTINSTRLKKQNILLPIDKNSQPDWQFMEAFIKQKQQNQTKRLVDYYSQRAMDLMIETGTIGEVEWKEFEVGQLFSFESKPSKGLNHLEKCQVGGTNYIGATNRNNGVLEYVAKNEEMTYQGNAIAFIRNGEGSMGYSIYKVEDFIATQDVSVGYNENLNRYNGLFITTVADTIRGKYNFGYKRNQTRLNKERLRLPVDKNGDPDWVFMENFIKQIERNKTQAVLNYYNQFVQEMRGGGRKNNQFTQVSWQAFAIEDICEILSGQDIYERERIIGRIPYITATANNNGIGYFVDNSNTTLEENCISVNRNGSVGYAFFHPYLALFGNDTRKLRPKYGDKYTALFITSSIEKQRVKYGYGYKMGTERLKKQKILLPINEQNQPDWDLMSSFMKHKELEQIVRYLKAKEQ